MENVEDSRSQGRRIPTLSYPCPHCQKEITSPIEYMGTEAQCPHCGNAFIIPDVELPKPAPSIPQASSAIKCRQCGGDMIHTEKVDSSFSVQIVGVLVFLIGVILLFFFPIGTLVGLILMIASARMGYKKTKIWKCVSCGYFFERAD